jgi:DNA-binding SARP family transcriptional activator/cytochrome c-type biogenesis protein CcmH/NrfG
VFVARVRIRTLGTIRIDVDEQSLPDLPSQPVRCALLLHLAVEGEATRDTLTALLWPERDTERARHSLSQTLYELRRQLGARWVESAGEILRVRDVGVDAVDFSALAAAGSDGAALALYEGHFLQGVHATSSAAFEAWVEQRRSRLHREYRTVARRHCAALHAAGRLDEAFQVAQRWAALDALDDEAHHFLIMILAARGQRAAALQCYDELELRLRSELDVAPLDETRALMAQLRADLPIALHATRTAGARSVAADDAGARLEQAGSHRKLQRWTAAAAGVAVAAVVVAAQMRAPAAETGMTREQALALELTQRGREYLNRPGESDVRKFGPAIELFHQALAHDSGSVAALTGLSDAYRMNVVIGMRARRDSALHFGRRAVAAGATSAAAYTSLGWAFLLAREWDSAGVALAHAHQLDPMHAETLSGLSRLAWTQRRFEDAVRWQKRAVQVEPTSPRHVSLLGTYLFDVGDLPSAEVALRQALTLGPDAPAPAWWLAQLFLIRGQPDSADAVMQRMAAAAAGHPGAEFLQARIYAQQGRSELASTMLERVAPLLQGASATVQLQQAAIAQHQQQFARARQLLEAVEAELGHSEHAAVQATRLRVQHAALTGDAEAAVALLRRSWESEPGGDPTSGPQLGLYWMDHDPLLAALHANAAFWQLLAQVRGEFDVARARLAFD